MGTDPWGKGMQMMELSLGNCCMCLRKLSTRRNGVLYQYQQVSQFSVRKGCAGPGIHHHGSGPRGGGGGGIVAASLRARSWAPTWMLPWSYLDSSRCGVRSVEALEVCGGLGVSWCGAGCNGSVGPPLSNWPEGCWGLSVPGSVGQGQSVASFGWWVGHHVGQCGGGGWRPVYVVCELRGV